MANEVFAEMLLQDDEFGIDISERIYVDRTAGTEWKGGIQEIGVTEEVVEKGDVGTVGWCYFRNLDTSNFLEIGKVKVSTDGDALGVKLLAGEWMIAPMNTSNVYARADTSAIRMEYVIIER